MAFSQKKRGLRFDSSLLTGGVWGLALGLVFALMYLVFTMSFGKTPDVSGDENGIGSVVAGVEPMQTARQEIESNSRMFNTQKQLSQDDGANLIDTIKLVESQFDKFGFRTFDFIAKEYDDPILRNAMFNVTLQHSIKKVGFKQTLNLVLAETHSNITANIIEDLVGIWSRESPVEALKHLETVDDEALRELAFRVLAGDWVDQDPDQVLQYLGLFPDSVTVFVEAEAQIAIASLNPRKAYEEILPSLSGTHFEAEFFRIIATRLAEIDVDAALELVLFNDALTSQTHSGIGEEAMSVLSDVLKTYARLEPSVAFEKALEIDVRNEKSVGPEVGVIGQIAVNDLPKALTLLPKVRTGTTKLLATTVVGLACVREQHFDKAVDLGKSLPTDVQGVYFRNLLDSWSVVSTKTLFDSLHTLPEAQRSSAAMRLMRSNLGIPVLDKAQEATLENWLNEQDRQQLAAFRNQLLDWRVLETQSPKMILLNSHIVGLMKFC